jgi:hypothetical protein
MSGNMFAALTAVENTALHDYLARSTADLDRVTNFMFSHRLYLTPEGREAWDGLIGAWDDNNDVAAELTAASIAAWAAAA